MRINQNIAALNAWRNLNINQHALSKSLERLSSGLRINRAADDAAGLAISEKMRGQVRGLQMAQRNAQDAISLIQTAEGALNETHAILQRMRELAVQAASDTNTDTDREALQKEINQLAQELSRIAETTEFNTKKLLDGTFHGTFHIGANQGQSISVSIEAMDAAVLGVGYEVTEDDETVVIGIDVSSQTAADEAITIINNAIEKVSEQRSALGAVQNRLEHTIQNLGVAAENLQAAESRIRDADMAREMSEFTRAQILQQASTAMLAQANLVPQTILQLLG